MVDLETCTACGTCMRFGCPAIERAVEDKAIINELCNGCGVCAGICPAGAIMQEVKR